MGASPHPPAAAQRADLTWVAALDLVAKTVLLVIVLRVALDPAWGNLEGKAPGTRAVTYPLLAFVVPVAFLARRTSGGYPWAADLLLTIPSFSDALGNRLDLYDRIVWFDDFMHFANTGLLAAAVLLLSGVEAAPLRRRLEVAISFGLTASLAWELWEYVAFVTRSEEVVSAYADTLGDLALGWGGAFTAAVLVGVVHQAGVRAQPKPARSSVNQSAPTSDHEAAWPEDAAGVVYRDAVARDLQNNEVRDRTGPRVVGLSRPVTIVRDSGDTDGFE